MSPASAACARPPDSGNAQERSSRRPGGSPIKKRVLIVEDEFLLALQMEQVLLGAGFEVTGLAADAATAVRLAAETQPQLVLMDVRLNGQRDGVDAAVEIWQRFQIRSLFVTGNTETATGPRAEAAHPVGVLSKPYRESDVIRSVQQAFAPPTND